MSTKTKPVLPPAQALKDVAAVLARHGAGVEASGKDSVSQEVIRTGTSHLKTARDRFQTSVAPAKRESEPS